MGNSMACTLEFILGRAGAGKTQALFERIKAVKETGTAAECIVIVPEQATFETEARLSDVLGGGLFGVTVTSWKPLASACSTLSARSARSSPRRGGSC